MIPSKDFEVVDRYCKKNSPPVFIQGQPVPDRALGDETANLHLRLSLPLDESNVPPLRVFKERIASHLWITEDSEDKLLRRVQNGAVHHIGVERGEGVSEC